MPTSKLPARPSLEYLRKLAKDRLAELRRTAPDAQLAAALLSVAQEHGFSSWRALKADIDRRTATDVDRFFAAAKRGDAETVRAMLRDDPNLVHARDEGHNATALHFSVGSRSRDTILALLDAGADIQAEDDVSELGVIGWLTTFRHGLDHDALSLLLSRGARHHIFSAIAAGDLPAIRAVVEENPATLDRRLSHLDHRQTALHYAITRGRHDILDLLIELGADVDAVDGNTQTALEYAMLRGDQAAVARLTAAGARPPKRTDSSVPRHLEPAIAKSIRKSTPVIMAPDVGATLRWYRSIGFTEAGRYPQDGTTVFWGMVSFGSAEVMFERGQTDGTGVTLLFVTDKIDGLYAFLKSQQIHAAKVSFVEDLHEPVFGGRQFSVRDPNGYVLRFLQEDSADPSLASGAAAAD